ncbi:hypothetical protein [Paenibacillus sp. 481]|uniref:hypothetical protein n=1 Tax=Paenibacillus sp. 481 TaxID=2835869 RepID=UPI001E2C08EB|nr:hypothetical protein [Paenibacillus sp. 481]UHA73466.1 hypothetical protein KIK04_23395 [Paenibacillus sp. 481]
MNGIMKQTSKFLRGKPPTERFAQSISSKYGIFFNGHSWGRPALVFRDAANPAPAGASVFSYLTVNQFRIQQHVHLQVMKLASSLIWTQMGQQVRELQEAHKVQGVQVLQDFKRSQELREIQRSPREKLLQIRPERLPIPMARNNGKSDFGATMYFGLPRLHLHRANTFTPSMVSSFSTKAIIPAQMTPVIERGRRQHFFSKELAERSPFNVYMGVERLQPNQLRPNRLQLLARSRFAQRPRSLALLANWPFATRDHFNGRLVHGQPDLHSFAAWWHAQQINPSLYGLERTFLVPLASRSIQQAGSQGDLLRQVGMLDRDTRLGERVGFVREPWSVTLQALYKYNDALLTLDRRVRLFMAGEQEQRESPVAYSRIDSRIVSSRSLVQRWKQELDFFRASVSNSHFHTSESSSGIFAHKIKRDRSLFIGKWKLKHEAIRWSTIRNVSMNQRFARSEAASLLWKPLSFSMLGPIPPLALSKPNPKPNPSPLAFLTYDSRFQSNMLKRREELNIFLATSGFFVPISSQVGERNQLRLGVRDERALTEWVQHERLIASARMEASLLRFAAMLRIERAVENEIQTHSGKRFLEQRSVITHAKRSEVGQKTAVPIPAMRSNFATFANMSKLVHRLGRIFSFSTAVMHTLFSKSFYTHGQLSQAGSNLSPVLRSNVRTSMNLNMLLLKPNLSFSTMQTETAHGVVERVNRHLTERLLEHLLVTDRYFTFAEQVKRFFGFSRDVRNQPSYSMRQQRPKIEGNQAPAWVSVVEHSYSNLLVAARPLQLRFGKRSLESSFSTTSLRHATFFMERLRGGLAGPLFQNEIFRKQAVWDDHDAARPAARSERTIITYFSDPTYMNRARHLHSRINESDVERLFASAKSLFVRSDTVHKHFRVSARNWAGVHAFRLSPLVARVAEMVKRQTEAQEYEHLSPIHSSNPVSMLTMNRFGQSVFLLPKQSMLNGLLWGSAPKMVAPVKKEIHISSPTIAPLLARLKQGWLIRSSERIQNGYGHLIPVGPTQSGIHNYTRLTVKSFELMRSDAAHRWEDGSIAHASFDSRFNDMNTVVKQKLVMNRARFVTESESNARKSNWNSESASASVQTRLQNESRSVWKRVNGVKTSPYFYTLLGTGGSSIERSERIRSKMWSTQTEIANRSRTLIQLDRSENARYFQLNMRRLQMQTSTLKWMRVQVAKGRVERLMLPSNISVMPNVAVISKKMLAISTLLSSGQRKRRLSPLGMTVKDVDLHSSVNLLPVSYMLKLLNLTNTLSSAQLPTAMLSSISMRIGDRVGVHVHGRTRGHTLARVDEQVLGRTVSRNDERGRGYALARIDGQVLGGRKVPRNEDHVRGITRARIDGQVLGDRTVPRNEDRTRGITLARIDGQVLGGRKASRNDERGRGYTLARIDGQVLGGRTVPRNEDRTRGITLARIDGQILGGRKVPRNEDHVRGITLAHIAGRALARTLSRNEERTRGVSLAPRIDGRALSRTASRINERTSHRSSEHVTGLVRKLTREQFTPLSRIGHEAKDVRTTKEALQAKALLQAKAKVNGNDRTPAIPVIQLRLLTKSFERGEHVHKLAKEPSASPASYRAPVMEYHKPKRNMFNEEQAEGLAAKSVRNEIQVEKSPVTIPIQTAASTSVNIDQIVEQVFREFEKKVQFEQQRRGL